MRDREHDVVDVAVVGGGISGLSAAEHIARLAGDRGATVDLRLLEAGPRPGGVIRTERVDSLLLEGGPDQFVTHKPAGLELCERVGLADDIVRFDTRTAPLQVVHRGRPVALPRGFRILAPTEIGPMLRSPLFSWRGKLRMAGERFVSPPQGGASDESLGAFVTRRFGREMTERVAEPIIGGIFAADVDRLSVDMAIPRFAQLERTHGSITRSLRAIPPSSSTAEFVALGGGMIRLVQRLASRLPEGWLQLDSPIERLAYDAGRGVWRLSGRTTAHEAGSVILACPPHVSTRLLRDTAPTLADSLSRLEQASCATVNLLYPLAAVRRKLRGFGFFVPALADLSILACSYVNLKFPDRAPGDCVLMRVFLGGARQPQVLQRDDEALARLAHRNLVGLLRIEGEPLMTRTYRFPLSMPQFPVGHRSRIESIQAEARKYPGLFLCGAAQGALGLPDSIAMGQRAAGDAYDHASPFHSRSSVPASFNGRP